MILINSHSKKFFLFGLQVFLIIIGVLVVYAVTKQRFIIQKKVSAGPFTGQTTVTCQIASSSDGVNEDGSTFESAKSLIWLGTGSSTTVSYTGLHFTGVAIPKGAVITSARLRIYSPQKTWINMSMSIAAEAAGQSLPFSFTNRPSRRRLTTKKVNHSSNTLWNANTWYQLDEIAQVIQEVVNRPDWQSGNTLTIILKSTGSRWERKYVKSFDGSRTYAPKLIITYFYSPTPTSPPDITPSSTMTPTGEVSPTGETCLRKGEGDANCDGCIDGIDYSIWLNSQCRPSSTQSCDDSRADFNGDKNTDDDDDDDIITQSCDDSRADFNGDKNTDDDDYIIWLNYRGGFCVATVTVEPTSTSATPSGNLTPSSAQTLTPTPESISTPSESPTPTLVETFTPTPSLTEIPTP